MVLSMVLNPLSPHLSPTWQLEPLGEPGKNAVSLAPPLEIWILKIWSLGALEYVFIRHL